MLYAVAGIKKKDSRLYCSQWISEIVLCDYKALLLNIQGTGGSVCAINTEQIYNIFLLGRFFYLKRTDIIVENVVPHFDFKICFLGSNGIVLKCVPESSLEGQKNILLNSGMFKRKVK